MNSCPALSNKIVERICAKLSADESAKPSLDSLSQIYKNWCLRVPFDNIQKRIWISKGGTGVAPEMDPNQFFQNWLQHGTGGTCWPTSNALMSLLKTLGYSVQSIVGTMMVPNAREINHTSILCRLEGQDYLVDTSLATIEPMPLKNNFTLRESSPIFKINLQISDNAYDVFWMVPHKRDAPIAFHFQKPSEPIGCDFLQNRYAQMSKGEGIFNDGLYARRRLENSILLINRTKKTSIDSENQVIQEDISTPQRRKQILVTEFGISEELSAALPADGSFI